MIERERLRELHAVDLPLHVLEQDYVQALFLQELYRASDTLVFKGGTFLKHAHGLDRFSEDLDFTQYANSDIPAVLSATAEALSRYGIPADLDQVERGENIVEGRLRYRGPLYDGSDRSRGSITLDVSTRGDILGEPEWRRLFFPYPDTRAVTVRCLSLSEAFAEKLRALSTRSRGRDLYDCWFLLEAGVVLDLTLFAGKMDALGLPAHVTISITDREWERDLSVLVEHPPPYETVLQTVTTAVIDAGVSIETP